MTSIVISSGHGKKIRGASCPPPGVDEVDEARKIVEKVAEYYRAAGVSVKTFHDDISTSQNENLNRIVDYHNSQQRDLDISVHLNAYNVTSKPMGCEVLWVTQNELAAKVSQAMADAGALINRGAKKRTDLFFLNSTTAKSILLEVIFVDSYADCDLYRAHFNDICRAIAEATAGVSIPGEHPPPLQPPEPEPEPEGSVVDLVITHPRGVRVSVTKNAVSRDGRVVVDVHHPEEVTVNVSTVEEDTGVPANQRGVTASVFGGSQDYNVSAYDEDMVLNDTDFYVALPDRIDGNRPKVMVTNSETGKSAISEIWDVGPWLTDEPYWITGKRPTAEICFNTKTPLPSGPHEGDIPSNPAGIDLSPALAEAIGIDGMGLVDWQFVEGDHVQRRLSMK